MEPVLTGCQHGCSDHWRRPVPWCGNPPILALLAPPAAALSVAAVAPLPSEAKGLADWERRPAVAAVRMSMGSGSTCFPAWPSMCAEAPVGTHPAGTWRPGVLSHPRAHSEGTWWPAGVACPGLEYGASSTVLPGSPVAVHATSTQMLVPPAEEGASCVAGAAPAALGQMSVGPCSFRPALSVRAVGPTDVQLPASSQRTGRPVARR